jgi:hypothetical protein
MVDTANITDTRVESFFNLCKSINHDKVCMKLEIEARVVVPDPNAWRLMMQRVQILHEQDNGSIEPFSTEMPEWRMNTHQYSEGVTTTQIVTDIGKGRRIEQEVGGVGVTEKDGKKTTKTKVAVSVHDVTLWNISIEAQTDVSELDILNVRAFKGQQYTRTRVTFELETKQSESSPTVRASVHFTQRSPLNIAMESATTRDVEVEITLTQEDEEQFNSILLSSYLDSLSPLWQWIRGSSQTQKRTGWDKLMKTLRIPVSLSSSDADEELKARILPMHSSLYFRYTTNPVVEEYDHRGWSAMMVNGGVNICIVIKERLVCVYKSAKHGRGILEHTGIHTTFDFFDSHRFSDSWLKSSKKNSEKYMMISGVLVEGVFVVTYRSDDGKNRIDRLWNHADYPTYWGYTTKHTATQRCWVDVVRPKNLYKMPLVLDIIGMTNYSDHRVVTCRDHLGVLVQCSTTMKRGTCATAVGSTRSTVGQTSLYLDMEESLPRPDDDDSSRHVDRVATSKPDDTQTILAYELRSLSLKTGKFNKWLQPSSGYVFPFLPIKTADQLVAVIGLGKRSKNVRIKQNVIQFQVRNRSFKLKSPLMRKTTNASEYNRSVSGLLHVQSRQIMPNKDINGVYTPSLMKPVCKYEYSSSRGGGYNLTASIW